MSRGEKAFSLSPGRRGVPKMTKLLISATLTTLTLLLHAQDDAPQRLAARAIGETPLFSDLRELCDGIGGRPTGSPACDRAIEWASAKFREAGADQVSVESFPVPNLWLPVSAEATVSAPARFPLRIAAAPFSPSTKGVIETRLIDAGEATPEAFAKLGDKLTGAIVLVRSKEMKIGRAHV